ncbi:unnamed protein product [Anisakis simplex]|uniref:Apoptosis inhibitor 5 (inferred by orthology to a human protein) n=1 Tax=Anisakis simplex TaxID=6269 RepID=A0A0M3K049_ANISI|nr:unnamed protein product [Anisakis simplex]
MALSPTLDDIYDACGRLDEAKGEKNVDDYALFLDGAKNGDAKVKKLSAQMIVRYWKNFTEQRNMAFYSLVSILEDRDPETRKAVIRELSQLVKTGELVDKIADVLSQMLQQTDDPQEMSILTNTLVQFLKSYPKGIVIRFNVFVDLSGRSDGGEGHIDKEKKESIFNSCERNLDVLSAIFVNITKSEDEAIRIRLLKFINEHLRDVAAKQLSAELRTLIEEQFREIMKDVTAAEFDLIFNLMRSMNTYESVQGRIFLYKMVVEQIAIEQPFPAQDVQRFDQILYFVERAQTLLSANCRSTDLMNYLVSKGIPALQSELTVKTTATAPVATSLKNRLLRAIAQLAPYAGTLSEERVTAIFEYLLNLIPPLPSEILETNVDGNGTEEEEVESRLKLSELEAVGLAIYTLFKKNRNIFNSLLEQKEQFSNWPKRIIYLAGLLQNYITSANNELKQLCDVHAGQCDRVKIDFLESALKMAWNVLKICKDLAHPKPTFQLTIQPSWNKCATTAVASSRSKLSFTQKSVEHASSGNNNSNISSASTSTKRRITMNDGNDEVKDKKERFSENYYVPPGGKYSGSVSGFNKRGVWRANWSRFRGGGSARARGLSSGRFRRFVAPNVDDKSIMSRQAFEIAGAQVDKIGKSNKWPSNESNVNTMIDGRYPIHYAADYGQIEIMQYLLSKGADVNVTDVHGITALLAAVFEGHKQIVCLLLSKGARRDDKAPDGRCIAECTNEEDIKQMLAVENYCA